MDDVAGHDAPISLVGDVDDDMARRMPETRLQDDAFVEFIIVVNEHHLLGFFHGQDAIGETDAMDAGIAPAVSRERLTGGFVDASEDNVRGGAECREGLSGGLRVVKQQR